MDDLVEELAKPVVQMIRDAIKENNTAKIECILGLLTRDAAMYLFAKLDSYDRDFCYKIIDDKTYCKVRGYE